MTRFNNTSDSNDESQEFGDATSEKYKWTSKAVTKLLTLRFAREHDFTYPIGKKIHIWDEIAEELKKDGYNVNGHACFSKYRNLISTYRRRKQMGDSFCRWEHFDLMDSHFGTKEQDSETEVVEETYEETPSGEDGSHSYYIVQQVDDVMQGDMQQIEDVEMVEHEEIELNDAEAHEVHVEIHEGEELLEHTHEEGEGNQIEEINVTVDTGVGEEFYWNPDATRLLLNLRLSKNYQWLKPNAKKLDLWNKLSEEMKEHNFNVEGHHCDMKYRNLLKTYRANKERMEKDGLACNWPYFDLMDSYLALSSSGLVEENYNATGNTALPSVFYSIVQDTSVEEKEDGANKRNKVSGYQWTPPAIRYLLTLRLEREHLFNKPLCRKLKLWNEISREMRKSGFDAPSHACNDKWRNTLTTYRKIKQKLEAYPEKTFVRWEYFDLMDSHLGHIPYKFTPMRKLLKTHLSYKDILEIQKGPQAEARVGVMGGATGTAGKRRQEEDIIVLRDDMADLGDIEEEESSSNKKPKLTLSDFLHKKLQADEKKRKERQVYEEKRLKVELQKLELERKKMEILKNLLSVLKSKTIT